MKYSEHKKGKASKEVNKICAERIAKNANPLALFAAAQQYPDPYYQAPKSHKSYAPPSKQLSSTRSHETTRYKGKEIAKPIIPLYVSASEEDSDPEQAQRNNDMQKNLILIAKYFKKIYKPTNNNHKNSSNTRNKNMDTSPMYKNDNQTGQFSNQRTATVVGARETVGSQVEQDDWLEDTEKEIDKQELEAHYSFMAKIHEVLPVDSGSDAEALEKTDQNDEACDDERVALANLIANLKLNIDENKKIEKQLKKVNTSMMQELKEYKSTLEETNRTLGESNNTLNSFLIALQNKQIGLEK
nr:hypothetical protein [Tanacetum cinerariifolium]